jgi:CheY-like chemotaxis protein
MVRPMSEPYQVPAGLKSAIRAGDCVAFVGAGFARPAMPTWPELLKTLTDRVAADDASLTEWLDSKDRTSRDYEGIAEVLRNRVKDDAKFHTIVREILHEKKDDAAVQRRLQYLAGIPFHMVLTTNFDPLLRAKAAPDKAGFGQLLALRPRRWWTAADWKKATSSAGTVPEERVLKLHGDLEWDKNPLVLSTRDYRKRLYETPGYRSFLRTLFTTKTILFMGFSFTDAYINEIRGEILSSFDHEGAGLCDYALLAEVSQTVKDHWRDADRLQVLDYPNPDNKHAGFDLWLKAIHDACCPETTLRSLVDGKRILWFDPRPQNNEYGFQVLGERDDEHRGPSGATVERVQTVDEALVHLRRGRFDVVISHFGYRGDGEVSNAEQLLRTMRREELEGPVIVFASGHHREQNRTRVLRLGAYAYADKWEELFADLEQLFGDPPIDGVFSRA